MVEILGGGGGHKQLPRRKIQEMKKNMQKVPMIKAKSDAYHKKQIEEADKTLDQINDIESAKEKEKILNQQIEEEQLNIRQQIINYIKNLFKQ